MIPNADQILSLHEINYPSEYKDLGEINDERIIEKIQKEQILNNEK